MKRLALSLILMLACLQAASADETTWLTDLSKAQAVAKEQKKLVLMDFTGSDWCPPCQQLHKRVLTSKEFEEYAKKNLVLVVVDFPRHKPLPAAQEKANNALAEKFSVEAFPTVIILDGAGKVLKKQVGYGGESAAEFISTLKAIESKKN